MIDCNSRVVLLLSGGSGSLSLGLVLGAAQARMILLSSAMLPGRLVVATVLRLIKMLSLNHRGGRVIRRCSDEVHPRRRSSGRHTVSRVTRR